ncbi:MAG TPA: hypothetical protein VMU89_09090 [Thermomicrobiaceae bacterium]|nr:hypothetical protein [Thermomicrobiaceae bacterium]
MNDTIAAAVFAEYRRGEGQRNRSGWQQPSSNRSTALRRQLAELLLTLGARLAPDATVPSAGSSQVSVA